MLTAENISLGICSCAVDSQSWSYPRPIVLAMRPPSAISLTLSRTSSIDQSIEEQLLSIELKQVQRELSHSKQDAATARATASAISDDLQTERDSMQKVTLLSNCSTLLPMRCQLLAHFCIALFLVVPRATLGNC